MFKNMKIAITLEQPLDVYNSDGEPLRLSMCLLRQAHSIAVGDK